VRSDLGVSALFEHDGARIAYLRRRLRLTEAQAAKALDVTTQLLALFEAGEVSAPDLEWAACAYLRAAGVDLGE
jgi:transcriptional regulator with XRE-family HTH domain